MDQEAIHFGCIFLEPTVGVEAIAILPEEVRVAVDDPGVYAENDLHIPNGQ